MESRLLSRLFIWASRCLGMIFQYFAERPVLDLPVFSAFTSGVTVAPVSDAPVNLTGGMPIVHPGYINKICTRHNDKRRITTTNKKMKTTTKTINPTCAGDSVPPGTFHGDSVPAGTFH